MAFKNLTAFGAGELTPELYERGNLDKFRTGLKTLRNATVTKMGGLKSRAGTIKLINTKSNLKAKYFYIQDKQLLLEFTYRNVRVYEGFSNLFNTFSFYTDVNLQYYMDEITNIHVTYDNKYIYVFNEGQKSFVVDLDPDFGPMTKSYFGDFSEPNNTGFSGATVTFAAGTPAPTGYFVEYGISFVVGGVETFIQYTNLTLKKPINTGEFNKITIALTSVDNDFEEVRIYQRPKQDAVSAGAGSYGLIGVVKPIPGAGSVYNPTLYYMDHGGVPDFTNNPPEITTLYVKDTRVVLPPPYDLNYNYEPKCKTGIVYQDRVVLSGTRSKNRVHATRTGDLTMTRDFPLQADSAIGFTTGSDGALEVYRFFDGRGLLIFTSVGVYETPADMLTPATAYAIKRGPYVCNENIAPVQLGGQVTIYDKRLKAVIGLTPSGNYDGYGYTEFSIYSSHLLKGKTIVSWALQDAETQILWLALDDGSVLSFSYQDEQLVRSWARHDFKDGLVEEIVVMKLDDGQDVVCFCVNRNGSRTLERLADRDANMRDYIGTDSSVIYKENVMASAVIPSATVAPVVPTEWDGLLTITPTSGGFGGTIGDIIRYYVDTYEFIDLEITNISLGVLTVQPNVEFPSAHASISLAEGLWKTYTTLTGLSHLNGKKVSVRLDGFTHASPLNTDRNYQEYTVSSGQIVLADDARGAFISVGLPFVTDIETLEVDTVEQAPTKLEGQIVNKIHLSYFESLFLYAAAAYPDDDTVTGMENQEYQVEPDDGILSTQPTLPQSERLEMQIQGDWKTKGSIALRNVDPQPIALRAIILDTEVIRN